MRIRSNLQSACLILPGVPLLLILAVCSAAARDIAVSTISGSLKDVHGVALEDVTVTLSDECGRVIGTTKTASGGSYTFYSVKPARYKLKAQREANLLISAEIDLSPGQRATVDLILKSVKSPSVGYGPTEEPSRGTTSCYQPLSLRADDLAGTLDPSGYSSGANADAATRLLEGESRSPEQPAARLEAKPPAEIEKTDDLESLLKGTATREPDSFEAKHSMGESYLAAGQPEKAVRYLEEAYHLDGSDRQNAYDLAAAYLEIRNLPEAEGLIRELRERDDSGQLHVLTAETQEIKGNFSGAIKEYQRAAEVEPTAPNVLQWGTALLLHGGSESALEVFKAGTDRYPDSAEMRFGLGATFYVRGRYDEAVRCLVQAIEIYPSDYRAYNLLAYASGTSRQEAIAVSRELKRFAEARPGDARAAYYYAVSLWNGSRAGWALADPHEVEALLKESSALDPTFPDPNLLLGTLYASQGKYADAIQRYRRAISLDFESAGAHYRLGQALAQSGNHELAEQEFTIFERLRRQPRAQVTTARGRAEQLMNLATKGASRAP